MERRRNISEGPDLGWAIRTGFPWNGYLKMNGNYTGERRPEKHLTGRRKDSKCKGPKAGQHGQNQEQ